MERIFVRSLVKTILGHTFRRVPIIRKTLDGGLTVFMFHEVSNCSGRFAHDYNLTVSPETFRNQVIWINAEFNVIDPRQLIEKKQLPKRAAIISFDDGFRGTFENAFPILEALKIPAIIFLNMKPVLERTPTLAATACYLNRYSKVFHAFAKDRGLTPPFQLTLTPNLMQEFELRHGVIDRANVNSYQGAFADLETLQKWDRRGFFSYGNHLFEHWNACALTEFEFEEQYMQNESALSIFKSTVPLFAFTNGQPGSCFTDRDLRLTHRLGARHVFSATGGVNNNASSFLLGRLGLTSLDRDSAQLWFRAGRAALTVHSSSPEVGYR
jgi:peptidoglycan/xylan/chitin deacetylase (PgdA/CDA1 family)